MTLRFRILLISCPLVLLPIGQYWYLSQGVKGFVSDKGNVVGGEHAWCGRGKNDQMPTDCWHMIVEYNIDGAHKGRLRSESTGDRPSIGEVVPILVNPNDRHEAVISGIRGYWASLLLVSILSLAFLLLAGLVAFFVG